MGDDHDGGTDDFGEEEVVIHVPPEHQAGVWANWGRIQESDNAFREPRASADGLRS